MTLFWNIFFKNEASNLSKCCSLQSLTKSWDSLRGFMHYVETSGFEIASLPHSNSLRFFHFVGIWTRRNNNRRVSSLNLPLLCKDSFVIPTHKLYPFFDRKRRLKIVANENYNRVEHRVDWHLALCPIVSCALKRPLSRTMSPKRYKHEQKMPDSIHCQKHLNRKERA